MYHGIPLCGDATLVSPLHCDGTPAHGSDVRPGASLDVAERKKQRTYPELVGGEHARLLVLAFEVGGRWCEEAKVTLRLLAAAKAREAPSLLRNQLSSSLLARWSAMLAVAAQAAFAATLLGRGHRGLASASCTLPCWGEF